MLTLDELKIFIDGAIYDLDCILNSDALGDSVRDYFLGIKMGYMHISDFINVSISVKDSES